MNVRVKLRNPYGIAQQILKKNALGFFSRIQTFDNKLN